MSDCPCCGRELVLPCIEHFIRAAPVLQTIFRLLCDHPHGLTKVELLFQVYRGREPNCDSALSARISQFNRAARLRRLGIRIWSKSESGRRYRIFIIKEKETPALTRKWEKPGWGKSACAS